MGTNGISSESDVRSLKFPALRDFAALNVVRSLLYFKMSNYFVPKALVLRQIPNDGGSLHLFHLTKH